MRFVFLNPKASLEIAASIFGEAARRTLPEITEKRQVAAEIFSAFRTGKTLERDTLALREQAIAMAVLLEPKVQENAA